MRRGLHNAVSVIQEVPIITGTGTTKPFHLGYNSSSFSNPGYSWEAYRYDTLYLCLPERIAMMGDMIPLDYSS